jgi:hypothetical protein
MFGPPTRQYVMDETWYTVPLLEPIDMDIRLECDASGCIKPTFDYDKEFAALRHRILTELVNYKQIFKHAPSYSALNRITTLWGFIIDEANKPVISPFITIEKHQHKACFVDLRLKSVTVSRTMIQPSFEVIRREDVIEIEWDNDEEIDMEDLEEVSDIPSVDGAGAVALRNPALLRREKAEAKERVRAAYRAATTATMEAERLSKDFYERYELSDSESAFTEWEASDEDSDSA